VAVPLLTAAAVAAGAAAAAAACCFPCFQVFLTHTPGVNTFFSMEPMEGLQWLRVFVCMLIVYFIVEIEKALVDPLLMPIIKPVLRWFERHTPSFLSVDQPLSSRLARVCGGKHLARMDSQYKFQKRGKFKRGKKSKKANSEGGEESQDQVDISVEMQQQQQNARNLDKKLSVVAERAHSHEQGRSSAH
jgi:hypothetical protein